MSRLLFLPAPAHGHVNPTLAVAAELTGRGHEVTYLLPAEFRGPVEAAGATLAEIPGLPGGPPSPPPVTDGGPHIAQLLDAVLGLAAELATPLLELHDRLRPDVAVVERLAPWGGLLATARGVPTVEFSASYVMGPGSPLFARMAAALPGGRPPIDPERLAAVGARFGVGATDPSMVLFGHRAAANVVFMPAEFHPGHETLGPDVHFVGPATGRTEDADLDLTPLAAAKGVYVSLGTVFNERKEFFASCLEAFGGGDRPVVLNHGRRLTATDLPAAPPNVVLASHVPQLRVLERSAVFVTHGGMGSTMEAVAAGVPMVVVPQMPEQQLTADRVAELHLGVRLDPADATAETLAAAVAAVLADPAYGENVARLGAAARAAGGARAAADVLEKAAA